MPYDPRASSTSRYVSYGASLANYENFDISQEKVDRQFAIGQKFYNLPLDEKLKYVPDLDNGEYNGYRPAGRRMINPEHGIHDRVEVYNIPSESNPDFMLMAQSSMATFHGIIQKPSRSTLPRSKTLQGYASPSLSY